MGLRVELRNASYQCTICHNHYASKSSLSKHRIKKHPTRDEQLKPYKCSGCDKEFRTDKGRRQHVKLYCNRVNCREDESIVEEYYECESVEKNSESVFCMYCYEGDFRGIKEVLEHMRECRLANNSN